MIYFHGIGEDLGNLNVEISTLGEMLEVDVLAVEYPGFGLNFHSGVSTEDQINKDAATVLDYLM
jgi:abhydrolase domain-containing protein 17